MESDTLDTQGQYLGNSPDISTPSLDVEQRVITSYGQAMTVIENLRDDAKVLVVNSARMTNVFNGRRPKDQKKLNDQNRGWRSNVNTGFLATRAGKIVPRFVQPIKTAKYLTAASLPAFTEDGTPWPNGAQKTEYFRECVTKFIKDWPQWNFHITQMADEVAKYGYCFNAYFDEYDWKPKLFRMDKAFVPKGTEVMDQPQFFSADWLYKPHELLALLKANKEAGRSEWNEEACVKAINDATAPVVNTTTEVEYRSYADLVRQGAYRNDTTKGYKVIATTHLFAREATGKVSHYVVLRDDLTPVSQTDPNLYLYEREDAYDQMWDVCIPIVFGNDATIHGNWGVGQRIFDLAAKVENSRNEAQDNLSLSTKQRFQVSEAKNINQVKVQVIDDMIVSAGANFAQNVGGISANTEAYLRMSAEWERYADELVGQYVPPIPLQPSDIKAAQVNAAMMKEEEMKNANLDNWLCQFAVLAHAMVRRATRKDSPLKEVKALRKKLLLKLTEEEIEVLRDQPPSQTVIDFTEYRAVQRAQFAGSVLGNQLFNQQFAAQTMATPLGSDFAAAIVVNEAQNNEQVLAAQRQQTLEANSFLNGVPVVVLASDPHVIHFQTIKALMVKAMESPQPPPPGVLKLSLDHASAHWSMATAQKLWDGATGNAEKSWLATVDKAIQESIAAQQNAQLAIAAQQQAAPQQAMPMQQPQV